MRKSRSRSQSGGASSKRRKRNDKESDLLLFMPREMTDTILAIDPTSRGFAFAVLEPPAFLVDWGERIIPAKTGGLLRKVDELLSRYEPTLLVVEDLTAPDARRRKRAGKEIHSIELLALKRGLSAEWISRLVVIDAFAPGKGKFEVALRLAEIFPVLARRLPSKRKAWITEDARMNIFDALGFAAALAAGTSSFAWGAGEVGPFTTMTGWPRRAGVGFSGILSNPTNPGANS
jgi:hypothetical protein